MARHRALVLQEGEPKFRRTFSIREAISRGGGHIASMLGIFASRKKSSKDILLGATIHDLDLDAFANRDSK